MKILLISSEYPPETGWGGIGSYMQSLALALTQAGAEVHVLAEATGRRSSYVTIDGIQVHRVPLALPLRVLFRGRYTPFINRLRTCLRVAGGYLALRMDFDVIEAPEWEAEALLLPPRSPPLVVHLHSCLDQLVAVEDRLPTKSERWAGRLERWSVRRASAVTAPTEEAGRLPSGRSWYAGPVDVVSMPLDLDGWTASNPPRAVGGILQVGRLSENKAPNMTALAAARLADIPGLRVTFIGSDHGRRDGGTWTSWLTTTLSSAGVGCEILPHLPRTELRALYTASAVVVVPSRHESYSMVAAEALSCATPVVVSSACGIAQRLSSELPQCVFRTGDAADLASKLRALLLDPDFAQRTGQKGAELVRQWSDPMTAALERLAIYERVSTRRRRGLRRA